MEHALAIDPPVPGPEAGAAPSSRTPASCPFRSSCNTSGFMPNRSRAPKTRRAVRSRITNAKIQFQVRHHRVALLFVEVEEHFGVGVLGEEAAAGRLEAAAKLRRVEDLAVERDPHASGSVFDIGWWPLATSTTDSRRHRHRHADFRIRRTRRRRWDRDGSGIPKRRSTRRESRDPIETTIPLIDEVVLVEIDEPVDLEPLIEVRSRSAGARLPPHRRQRAPVRDRHDRAGGEGFGGLGRDERSGSVPEKRCPAFRRPETTAPASRRDMLSTATFGRLSASVGKTNRSAAL